MSRTLETFRLANTGRDDEISPTGPSYFQQAGVCLLMLAAILLWLWFWPYSGDGDSVMHYLAARTVWADPSAILGSWSRPLHKVLIIVPAIWGIVPARICQAVITTALAWQTISLARQLKIPNALLAGPLLVFQPYVFTLASDTMTEVPTALAIVIAMRLWLLNRRAWSAMVVSFLPLLRPEGFFIIAMWAMLLVLPLPAISEAPGDVQLSTGKSDWRKNYFAGRLLPLALLSVGLVVWMAACFVFTGTPIYFLKVWSWPMGSFDAYRAGPIYHYAMWWPPYCGLILIGPFLLGVLPSARRRGFGLLWGIWLLVFVLHTLLFWLHKFASVGLLRILVCTAPMTALICLEGCNAIARRLTRGGYSLAFRKNLSIGAMALAMCWAMAYYAFIGEHYHCFGYQRLAREASTSHLLDDFTKQQSSSNPASPRLIAGDDMFLAMLGMINRPRHYVPCAMDLASQRQIMIDQPLGTVGAWDNEQAVAWHSVQIDDLPALGYTIVYEYAQSVPDLHDCLKRRSLYIRQRYVLFRKDRMAK